MTRHEAIAAALHMRRRGVNYRGIAVAMAHFTEWAYSEDWWRRTLRAAGAEARPRGIACVGQARVHARH